MPLKLSFLYGVSISGWWRLLRDNSFDIDRSGLGAAALISAMAPFNSLGRRLDRWLGGRAKAKPPVFLLGHWRSGTTHLHALLTQDPRLRAPTTYEMANPHGFLLGRRWHRPLLAPFAPTRRPQDNMAFGLDSPQEDEIGLAALCPFTPYTGWAFPRHEARYRKYLTFEDAAPEEREAFLDALQLLMDRLSVGHDATLVLKSPGHTARIPMLLERWPDARFVVIHRDPYEVFQSSLHLYHAWWPRFAFLQDPTTEGLEERVLDLYEEMHRRFFETEALLPQGRTSTVGFEALSRDPMGTLRKVYAEADLGDAPEARLAAYLSTVRAYQQNRYAPIEERWRREVARRWKTSFERWGYPS